MDSKTKKLSKLMLIFSMSYAMLSYAASGDLNGVTLSAPEIKAGQEVVVTITAEGESPKYCGLEVDFADGEKRQIKVDSLKGNKLPMDLKKTYSKPGIYNIKVKGKKVTTHFACTGNTVEAKVNVSPAALATNASTGAATATAITNPCPDNYKLIGKIGKKGEFKCSAGKGVPPPEKALACPEGLSYVQGKGFVSCRK